MQYYTIPIPISCLSLGLILPGRDREKLIGGRVRACGHRWAGLGQDAGPWQGTGSGPVGGTTIESAPGQPADGGGSSLGLEMALHPSTNPLVGPSHSLCTQQGAPPHPQPSGSRLGTNPHSSGRSLPRGRMGIGATGSPVTGSLVLSLRGCINST